MSVRRHRVTEEFFQVVEDFGLSIPKFSIAAHMSSQTFYNWHRGLANPTVATMDRALDAIGYELRIVRKDDE